MTAPTRRRPGYSATMATLAVALSLTTGTAYAAGLGRSAVKARNIASDAVQARHLSDGSVRNPALGNGAVGSRVLADGGVEDADLGTGAVGSRALADGSVTVDDMGVDSVGSSELRDQSVDGARIEDESITGIDLAPDTVSSTRMTVGVKNLLFNAGTLAVNRTFSDVSVTNSSWPSGAPASGAQFSASWSQPANTLDVVFATARVEYPASCSETASATGRGFDVKVTDGSDRVVSTSSPQRTDGSNYNGNGFWDQQEELPGVSYRAPSGTDLAANPAAFIDYIHLPIEMAEFVTGSSSASRVVKVFLKRNSSSCAPVVTDTRVGVYRFAS